MDVLAHTDWTQERLERRINEGHALIEEVSEPDWSAIVSRQLATLEQWRACLSADEQATSAA